MLYDDQTSEELIKELSDESEKEAQLYFGSIQILSKTDEWQKFVEYVLKVEIEILKGQLPVIICDEESKAQYNYKSGIMAGLSRAISLPEILLEKEKEIQQLKKLEEEANKLQ